MLQPKKPPILYLQVASTHNSLGHLLDILRTESVEPAGQKVNCLNSDYHKERCWNTHKAVQMVTQFMDIESKPKTETVVAES